ncbi:DUF4136 domain-containing protein [Shewanella waksmanii]|uniref:DUF4136 domain-containing protein n=1 Tax=Shewanella waksmanii TaxID=213783 RepID=UPI0037360157
MKSLLICLFSLSLIAGCASKPKQDYDTNYDFSQLQRFAQLPANADNDLLSGGRIEQAILETLLAKGFDLDNNAPQFQVTYAFKVEDKPKDSGMSIGVGTGTWGSSGGVSVGTSVGVPLGNDHTKVQTIQIDMIDVASNRLIWRGTDKFNFDAGGEQKAADTRKTVEKILAQFPPSKTQ